MQSSASTISGLQVILSVGVRIRFVAAVERCPFRLVFEEAHRFNVLHNTGIVSTPL